MFASNKGSVVRDEVVVAQGQVSRPRSALDLDQDFIGVGGKGGRYVDLHRLRGPHAYGQGVRGGEFGCVVEVASVSREDSLRAPLWSTHD